MNRGMPAGTLVQHFTRVGTEWEISEPLRSVVRARHLNLADPFPELGHFDVVLLRNVLIYFDAATRTDIMRRLHPMLAGDGYLLLGAAETATESSEHWRLERHGRISIHRPMGPADHLVGAASAIPTITATTGG